jgi:hypothetical protein
MSADCAIGSVTAAKDAAVKAEIAYTIQAKALDAARQQGDAANQLLAQAAQLSKSLTTGTKFDAVG